MQELLIPPEALNSDDAQEFIRFWVADGADHVSLHVGAMGDRETMQWGMMIADITVHIVKALRLKGSSLSEDQLRAEIERAYISRLKSEFSDYTGSLLGSAKN
jgi:Domain of unknown function (DUF5076)